MAIDFYEMRLQEPEPCQLAKPLVVLLHRFPRKRLTEVVMFQLLQHSPAPGAAKAAPPPAPARPAQFLAVASMIQQGLVDLDTIWSYLEPLDDDMKQAHADLMKKHDEEVAKSSTVEISNEKGAEKDSFDKAFQNFNKVGHQKFLLVAALISVNCWAAAQRALLYLAQVCKPALNDHIRSALCDLLKWLIAPFLGAENKLLPNANVKLGDPSKPAEPSKTVEAVKIVDSAKPAENSDKNGSGGNGRERTRSRSKHHDRRDRRDDHGRHDRRDDRDHKNNRDRDRDRRDDRDHRDRRDDDRDRERREKDREERKEKEEKEREREERESWMMLDPVAKCLGELKVDDTEPGRGVRRFSFAQIVSDAAKENGSTTNGAGLKGLCQTTDFQELLPQIRQVMDHLEYFMHTDIQLLSLLWRVLLLHTKQKAAAPGVEPLDDGLVALVYKSLLPASSMVSQNPHLNELMWSVISQLSVLKRYTLYSCWETMYDNFALKLVCEKSKNSAKQILKRVVANESRKENQSQYSTFSTKDNFSKLCNGNPIPALEIMVKDIERGFNVNLIPPYIDSTSRCTDMTNDVMGYVLTRLCGKPQTPGRMFLNQEDAVLSPWLANLGEYVGRFYKKHPGTDMHGLLKVVAKGMNTKGEGLIKVILENLIEYVGGFTIVQNMNPDQLLCLAGGPRLRGESISYGRKEDFSRKEKMRQTLTSALIDLGVVRVLWYSVAQQHQHFLSEEFSEKHSTGSSLKLLGLLFDGNHECFLRITEFLTQACAKDKYSSLLPPIAEVFAAFEPASAFLVIRAALPPYGRSTTSQPALTNGDSTAATEAAEKSQTLQDLDKVIRLYLPTSFEAIGLSMSFYVTFWRLSLQDIYMPADGYEKTINGITANIKQIEVQIRQIERDVRDYKNNREYKALRRDVPRLQDMQGKLKAEQQVQTLNHLKVMARLKEEKDHWFDNASPDTTSAFVAHMIGPRVLTSHADAIFCCRFVKLLIQLKTPGMNLLDFYNQWTIMLTQTLKCCSEREAQIFGVFLQEMMSYVLKLRTNEDFFKEEMKDNPVFHRNYYEADYDTALVEVAKFDDFRKGHSKWEGRIHKAMKQGLESEDWMEKRNSLLLLSQSYEAFPVVEKYAKQVLETVEKLRDKEEFADLKTLANSLCVKLKSRRDHWVDKAPPPVPEKKAEDTKEGSKRSKNALQITDAPSSSSKAIADGDKESRPASSTQHDADGKKEASTEKSSKRDAESNEKSSKDKEKEKDKDHHKDGKEKDGKTRDRADSKTAKESKEPKESRPKESRPKEPAEKQKSEKDRDQKTAKTSSTAEKAAAGATSKEAPSKRAASSTATSAAPASAGDRVVTIGDDRPEKRRRSEREESSRSGAAATATSDRHSTSARNALAPEEKGSSSRAPSPHRRENRERRGGDHHATSRHGGRR